MARMTGILASLALGALLAGCATTRPARMHSEDELVTAARGCDVAMGNLAQFEEEPRLLFLLGVQTPEQFACTRRWARRNRLRLVYVEGAEVAE